MRGLSIVEILVVVVIISIGLVSILGLANFSLKGSILIKETARAKDITEATMEAVRNFRDNTDWNNDDPENKYDGLGVISPGVAYHLEKSTDIPPKWMLIQGEKTVNDFTQKIVFENVSRNPTTHDIENTYNPTNDDADTKKTIVTISWKNKKVEIVTYLTNWQQ